MDKKFEDKIAKMAFGELSEAEAAEVKAHAAANADAAQALASYESIRSDLRRMRDVPPDQLSKERLQNAILTQGLKPKPVRRAFPWAWASTAAVLGALALAVWMAPRDSKSQQVAFNEPKVSPMSIDDRLDLPLNEDDRRLVNQAIANFGTDAPIASSQPKAVSKPIEEQPIAMVERHVNRSWGRHYHGETDRGNRPPLIETAAEKALDTAALTFKAPVVKKEPETLVLIQSDKDNSTGASNAVEVHQTQDVIVSS